MITRSNPSVSNSLADLAARIKVEHDACTEAEKRGLQHAAAAGKMLIEAKAQLKHGQWLPWLRDHCSLSERKAQRYMAIAPHIVPKSDSVSDLTPPDPVTWEWAGKRLDQPFIDQDFAGTDEDCIGWRLLKLMRHAGVPLLPSLFLTEGKAGGHSTLRLCTFDDLEAAVKAIAPFASGKASFRIDRNGMEDVLESINTLTILAMWLTGKLLIEIKYRFDLPDDDDERYTREWHETHAAWMAQKEAQLANESAVTATTP
jgi:hypothetical protein